MSVFDRSTLVDSPLADLHTIATELSIDGFRRLRRADLITAILAKQGGDDGGAEPSAEEVKPPSSRRGTRRPRTRVSSEAAEETDAADVPAEATATATEGGHETSEERPRRSRSRRVRTPEVEEAPEASEAPKAEEEQEKKPRRAKREKDEPEQREERPARSRRGRAVAEDEPETDAESGSKSKSETETETETETIVTGDVELLPNGSGFVRVAGPEPSDEDVYISAAQVKRCELVSGDTVSGPKRAPRRSERFASLVRIETINGRPASELADSVRFDDLPAALPSNRLKIGSEDPTLKAIEWLTPFGRGSRVTIVGPARAGKTEALRRLGETLAAVEGLTVTVALAGVRPEEISLWAAGPTPPAGSASFAASEDAQAAAIEPVIDQAKRLAARGAHAVVLVDTLDGLQPHTARRVMAAARNIVDGGSVTVIATAAQPVGGETTVIALDVALTSIGRFPALDLLASGCLHPELLVGEAGADAIARTRADISEDGDEG